MSEYKHCLKLILSSQLFGHYKFRATNSFALPVLRYLAAIVHWPVHTLRALDRQTRKLLTLFRGLRPKSDVDCLYLPRNWVVTNFLIAWDTDTDMIVNSVC